MAKKDNEAKTNNKQKRHFFKDMKAELKKVIWPTAKQTTNNTLAVIGFTLALAVIVFVLDVAFEFANNKGIVTLQEKVKSSYSVNNTTDNSTENATESNSTDNATTVEANSTKGNATNKETNTESKK